jgi:hypothetical protein
MRRSRLNCAHGSAAGAGLPLRLHTLAHAQHQPTHAPGSGMPILGSRPVQVVLPVYAELGYEKCRAREDRRARPHVCPVSRRLEHMIRVVELPVADWQPECTAHLQAAACEALECGQVLLFPKLAFPVADDELVVMGSAAGDGAKNVSFDPARNLLRGSGAGEDGQRILARMMQRYASATRTLLDRLLPLYRADLEQGRTSFRPTEIAGRVTSWRKDDTRLHIDSFPSTPVQGRRILRVFANIDPRGGSRRWRLGEPFADVAERFVPTLPAPLPGSAPLLEMLGVTKSRRTAYDHYMLRLHDAMKADLRYQSECDQAVHEFAAGCTWAVFTDQASHAATRGQHALEQTYYLPVEAMQDASRSPLHILERQLARALV